MKKLIIILAVSCLLINFCNGQHTGNADFIEVEGRTSRFIESSFLANSKYQTELNNPFEKFEELRLIPAATESNYAIKFRYGKQIFAKTYLIGELGFSKYNEQTLCVCDVCDKAASPTTLVSLKILNFGIGVRHQVFRMNRFSLSVEAIGSYSVATNESGVDYFGYAISPVLAYQITEKWNLNFRAGYEQSFQDYQKKEKFYGIGVNYLIRKNSS